MSTTKLGDLLNPSNDRGLGDIVRRAQDMGDLTGALSRAVGDEMAGHVVAANVRENGELVVLVSSSAWASRLRFEADKLLDAAVRHGTDAASVTIRVARQD